MSEAVLQRKGVLAYLDEESLGVLTPYGEVIATKPLEVLIGEGMINTRLFIVLAGTFNVTTKAQGKEVLLDTVGPGDCLGEVALFTPDRASASVVSLQAGKLWTIDAKQLQEFLNDQPEAGCAAILGINVILSRRLKRANDVIKLHEIVPGFLSVRAKQRAETGKLGKFERK